MPGGGSDSDSSGDRRRKKQHITLFEFLALKHASEFNNMIERLLSSSSSSSGECAQGIKQLLSKHMGGGKAERDQAEDAASALGLTAQAAAVLNLLHAGSLEASRSQSDESLGAAKETLIEEVVLWCSLRGQTLARTVRGLIYTAGI